MLYEGLERGRHRALLGAHLLADGHADHLHLVARQHHRRQERRLAVAEVIVPAQLLFCLEDLLAAVRVQLPQPLCERPPHGALGIGSGPLETRISREVMLHHVIQLQEEVEEHRPCPPRRLQLHRPRARVVRLVPECWEVVLVLLNIHPHENHELLHKSLEAVRPRRFEVSCETVEQRVLHHRPDPVCLEDLHSLGEIVLQHVHSVAEHEELSERLAHGRGAVLGSRLEGRDHSRGHLLHRLPVGRHAALLGDFLIVLIVAVLRAEVAVHGGPRRAVDVDHRLLLMHLRDDGREEGVEGLKEVEGLEGEVLGHILALAYPDNGFKDRLVGDHPHPGDVAALVEELRVVRLRLGREDGAKVRVPEVLELHGAALELYVGPLRRLAEGRGLGVRFLLKHRRD
mmetsp:Transcript_64664/g.204134  ORF Transcript_64664/g.204134 Transcript_64664/m.204134 type:complete len:400 (-) Transcript_64664:1424-2623(-)